MLGLSTMLDDLRRLVEVESPSHDLDALRRSAGVLADVIAERTGVAARIDEGPLPHVHWRGGGAPKVLLLGHHDTVFPIGALAERPFAVADGSATGPGVFDMKAGIVQAIHAVAALPGELAAGVEMLWTADEEVGSTGSRALLEARAAACGNVLVFEASADGGALKTGRKGAGTFEVVVTGRASHAGLDPDAGRNALVEMAHQVLAIAALGDPSAGTTVTPTVAHVGTADNVVPAEGRLLVDVRVTSAGEKARVEAALGALTAVTADVAVVTTGGINRPPMPEQASARLFPLARAVQPDIGGVFVGGASDGNFTAAIGVPTLDGLGAIGGGAHAAHEWVDVATMPARVALTVGILEQLLRA